MYNRAKVSIIVPIYNASDYIERCVKSICAQSLKDIQVILIDDGSSDDSLKLCEQLKMNDERIEVYHHENRGASATRNTGLKYATAEWIMFVDSDDWIEKNAVEVLYKHTRHDDSDVIIGMIVNNYSFSDIDALRMNNKVYRYDMNKYRIAMLGGCIIEPQVFSTIFPVEMRQLPFLGSPCAKIYRKELLKDRKAIFLENIHYGEDTIFNLNVLDKARTVYYVNTPVYHYCMRAGSLSTGRIDNKYKQYIDYVTETEKYIEKLNVAESEEFKIYRSLDLVQMVWELAEMYGMSLESFDNLIEYKKQLKKFAECTECKTAMKTLKLKDLPDKKHRIMVFFLQKKLYFVAIASCTFFYKLFRKKKRI